MANRYFIPINEDTLDLVMFLNDGVRPQIEEKETYLVCEINTPRENTTRIKFEHDLLKDVYLDGTTVFLK